jgi:peroxiredoxin
MSTHDNQAQLAKGKVQVGDLAPDFTLPDQSGTLVGLGDFLGKTHIMYNLARLLWKRTSETSSEYT